MSYERRVKLWSEAVKKSARKVLSSKKSTRKFMRKAGIIAKGGNQLAKSYR